MAGANKEEFPPLLPAGFHKIDQIGRRRLCLDRFPDSVTRPSIMANVEAVIAHINQQGIPGDIWIDGSFLTEKLNPDDADIAFVVPRNVFPKLNGAQTAFFTSFSTNSYYDQYRIDNYGISIDQTDPQGQWLFAYWLRQFGFSRSEKMKGILQVTVPFLVSP
jgi:predicted nucleotidyltransferase